jgi:hypothetical protein|tara:strand:- start:332 stop:1060 length:729 start_codon:yes stop_codon:yes gene_type:complete
MNFIKKAIDGQSDPSVHLQFQKFSKGEFRNKGLIEAKAQAGGKYTIKTSAEFANDLVRYVAEKLGSEKTKVTGAIVSTTNLKEIPEYNHLLAHAEVKQFQGVRRFLIDVELTGEEIIKIVNAFPKTFFALTFSHGDNALKIKPKAPKSAKPGKEKEDGPKADFCSLKTKDKSIVESFIFEKPDFKEAKINHTIFVERMVIPDGLKEEKDFAKIREESKRAGRILRKSKIDDQESEKEYDFEA